MAQLSLYLAVHKDDLDCIKAHDYVPLRFTSPGKSTIELCEKMEDAVKRYCWAFGPTPKDQLVLLQVVCTPLGIAHYTTDNCGPSHDFQCRLSKKIWNDGVDYGVWHFIGDLPLRKYSVMSGQCLHFVGASPLRENSMISGQW